MKANHPSDMGENKESEEEHRLGFGLQETMEILSAMSLTSVTMGDFLVITRSEFDLTISGEPYTALQLLFSLKTGKYLSRIWNQTAASGIAERADQVKEVCRNLFNQGRPCLGSPQEGGVRPGEQEFLISQTPIPRKIATKCLKVLGTEANAYVTKCTECLKMSEYSECQANVTKSSASSGKISVNSQGRASSFQTEYKKEPGLEENIDFATDEGLLSAEDFQGDDGSEVKHEQKNTVLVHRDADLITLPCSLKTHETMATRKAMSYAEILEAYDSLMKQKMSKRRVAEELCISYTTLVSIVSCRKAMMNSPMGNLARSRISLSKSKKKDFHRDKGKEIDIENKDTVVVRKAPRMPYTQGTRKTRKVVSMAEMLTAYDTLMEEQEMSTQRAAEELGISHRSLLSVVSCREEITNCPEGTLACSKFYLYGKKTISFLEEEQDKIPQMGKQKVENEKVVFQREATMPYPRTTPQTKPKQKRMSMAEILKAFDTLVVEEEEMSTLRAAEKLNIPYPTLLSVVTCRKEIENCPEGGLAQSKFNLTDAKLSPVVQEERVKRNYSKLPQLSMKDECYECPKCPAKKSNKNNLVFHMRRVHLWGQFSCAQCGTKAEYADDLLAHIKENDHTQADILFLKHACSILRLSSNPVCGFSMMEQVRPCAV